VSASVFRSGGALIAGVAFLTVANSASADDCFAFFRRCPADSGVVHATAFGNVMHLCPPRCPPYCDPTFGFYPTAWRSWPTLCADFGEEVPAGKAPATVPGTAPTGPAPRPMPPADSQTRRLPAVPPPGTTGTRSVGQLPPINGATAQ
jgi:hypothetical protein